MKRDWKIPFFNHIKIKWSTWVSYSFKAAPDYSSLYRSMHFWFHDTTLMKIFSIEQLNLTWNRQTNFTKLRPLSKVFQIALGVGGRIFAWGKFFYWVVGYNFDHSNLFQTEKEHSVNIEHWLKSKLAWPVYTRAWK